MLDTVFHKQKKKEKMTQQALAYVVKALTIV